MSCQTSFPNPPPQKKPAFSHYNPGSSIILGTDIARLIGSGKEQPTGDDDAVWGEVIRKHFTTHAKSIVETTKKWKGRKRNDGNHARLMTEIRDSMTRHGFL